MPQIQGLIELRGRCQARADMPSPDQFVGTTELNQYIQKSYERLYNLLVGKYENYFIKRGNETVVFRYDSGTAGIAAGVASYSYPIDYFKIVRMAIGTGPSKTSRANVNNEGEFELQELRPCTWREELMLNPKQQRARPSHYVPHGRSDYAALPTIGQAGAGFRLVPIPDISYLLDFVYIPVAPIIAEGEAGQGVDFVNGWDEFLVLDVAIKMRDKQESDTSLLIEERDFVLATIESVLSPRDPGHPAHVDGAAAIFDDEGDPSEWLYD